MDTSLWGLVSDPLAYPVPFTAELEVEANCFEVGGWVDVYACRGLVSGPLTYPVPFTAEFEFKASCYEVGRCAKVNAWGLVSDPLAYPVPFTAEFGFEANCFEVGGWWKPWCQHF